jgi:Flp pilus assembly protein TadD
LEKIVKQNLLYQRAAFLLGSLYAREGKAAEAAKLQRSYQQRQSKNDAHSRFALQVSSRPADAEAHYQKGLSHQRRNELPRAVCELKEAIRLRPADLRPRAPLAEILRQQDRPQEAEAALKGIISPY